jgi:acylphosphatase
MFPKPLKNMKNEDAAAHVRVKGRVQGVGYRFFVQEAAETYGLKGWVRNVPGGDVESEVEGPKSAIMDFVKELRKGPPLARVDDMHLDWRPPTSRYTEFEIRS